MCTQLRGSNPCLPHARLRVRLLGLVSRSMADHVLAPVASGRMAHDVCRRPWGALSNRTTYCDTTAISRHERQFFVTSGKRTSRMRKARSLTQVKVAEAEDFVDFLRTREAQQHLTHAAAKANRASFAMCGTTRRTRLTTACEQDSRPDPHPGPCAQTGPADLLHAHQGAGLRRPRAAILRRPLPRTRRSKPHQTSANSGLPTRPPRHLSMNTPTHCGRQWGEVS